MALSRQAFVEGLHSECLEEAAFLYQQRAFLRADGHLTRRELGRLEQRLDAFLDAACVGRDATAALCVKRTEEGDPGDWYVAARLLGRLGLHGPLAELLGRLDVGDEERVVALREGLCHQMHGGTLPTPSQLPAGTPPLASALLVTALGHGRRSADWVLPWTEQMLRGGQGACIVAAAEYLGRLRTPGAADLLRRCLDVDDVAVKRAAAHALLRLGDPLVVSSLLAPSRFPVWACPVVGLGGSRDALRRLVSLVENGEGDEGALLALGALGVPSAVPVLIAQLANAGRAEKAAWALHLLTGADLWEQVVEREALDEAELFSDEKDTAGGITLVRRLSRNAEDWNRWWKESRARFDSAPRWRAGKPFSPGVLLDALSAEAEAGISRELASDELAIRYGVDWGFEPDALQSRQELALRKGRAWLKTHGHQFTEGRWYLAGRPL